MKICFITAITGNYECRLREPIQQTIPTEFIAFTDRYLPSKTWTTYPLTYHPNTLKDPYTIAKWYKCQFYKINILQEYSHIVWIDGSIEITNKNCAKWITQKNIFCTMFCHEWCNGILMNEALGSRYNKRYSNENPLLTLDKYYDLGFKETHFRLCEAAKHPDYGVWITCFVAWKNTELLKLVLDDWYSEYFTATTNDQLALPYVLWKHEIFPYCLPDGEINGVPHMLTDFYTKHQHNT